MQTALNVAEWFLSRNKIIEEDCGGEPITNMKLQKLLYYAQGLYLAKFNKPLFNDDIENWTHGPVVASIYDEYKINKNMGIVNFNPPIENFTDDEEEILKFTLEEFGQFSASKLRNMTHEETPWKSTKRNDVIPQNIIAEYFKENYIEEA